MAQDSTPDADPSIHESCWVERHGCPVCGDPLPVRPNIRHHRPCLARNDVFAPGHRRGTYTAWAALRTQGVGVEDGMGLDEPVAELGVVSDMGGVGMRDRGESDVPSERNAMTTAMTTMTTIAER